MSQLALAWVLGHPAVSTALVGARTPAEVDANDAGAQLELSDEERRKIEEILGGAAGTFITPDELDLPLTFEATRAASVALGSGVVVVLDDSVDLVPFLQRIAAFFRDESCGQCVPCRVGSVRQEELLERLAHDRPLGSFDAEAALFRDIAQAMRDASICGLGQTASSAIESAMVKLRPFRRRS